MSAEVRWVMRVEGRGGVGLGVEVVGWEEGRAGRVRAWAMLQALAPRSRTRSKLRLMSWDGVSRGEEGGGGGGWATSKRSVSRVATSSRR